MQPDHNILTGTIYLHFKGKEYEVLSVVMSAVDESLWVHYKALYESGNPYTWIRPLEEFTQVVCWPDGVFRSRFIPKLQAV